MVAMSKTGIGLMTCGLMLCMGLSTTVQAGNSAAAAAEELKQGQPERMKGEQNTMKGHEKGHDSAQGQTIKGEVLRVEGDTYFVKGPDGKEVRLQTDQDTQKVGSIQQGDRIEAKMNDQNRALSIRSARGTEAGQNPDDGATPGASRDSQSSSRER